MRTRDLSIEIPTRPRHRHRMAFDKEEKRRRRALKAGSCPRPRGRAPRGSNGRRQKWCKERGGWSDDSPAWAWSSGVEFPELGGDALTSANSAATVLAAPVAAAPATAWKTPIFWQLEESSEIHMRRAQLHEHVQLMRCGSRVHTFEHISPGGAAAAIELPSPSWKRQARERVARLAAEQQALQNEKDERAARVQQARERRAALALDARCGSCTTCAQLSRFGGWKSDRATNVKPCETALLQLDGECDAVCRQECNA